MPYSKPDALVSTDWLAQHLSAPDVRVVDATYFLPGSDRDARAELYRQIQRIVREDAPWAFVANWKQNAVTTERVQGFELQPSFLLNLAHVSKAAQ